MTALVATRRANRPSAATRTARALAATPALAAALHVQEAVDAAKSAGLRYMRDDAPGITRKRRGKSFTYWHPGGGRITDEPTLARIRSLAVPPAWEHVWICPSPHGHIQATGRDAKGRKQYRYHPRFRAIRDETKFHRLAAFARALPRIRARVEADMKRPGLDKNKVLATVVRLLELTRVRVGNEEYVRENGSYGLTTLVSDQADIDATVVHFHFQGKSGVEHDITVKHARLARILKACQELPGEELFKYVDAQGATQVVDSADVNAYIREAAGDAFSAKDFRTWAGTVHAALTLLQVKLDALTNQRGKKKCVVAAIKETALALRNRPATCRKYYVHPAILASFEEGRLHAALSGPPAPLAGVALSGHELAVLHLLESAIAPANGKTAKKKKKNRAPQPHRSAPAAAVRIARRSRVTVRSTRR